MELLGLGLVLLVILGAVLVVVILLTRGIFARDLTRALKRVTQQEQELQEKATILEERINQMERDYHAKLKRAEAEAQRVLQEAKNQAMNIRTAAIEEAKHRARQLLLEAEQNKNQFKSEVTKELNGQAIQQACQALRSLLPEETLAALHTRLVDELMSALTQLDTSAVSADVHQIEVRTAQPLTHEQSRRLTQWADTKWTVRLPLQVAQDDTIIAGCAIHLGATIIDNTLINRLRQQ